MRRPLLLLLVVGCLAVPLASGHGDHSELHHLTVNVQDLEPGEFDTYDLKSESEGMMEGDFQEGWIVTLFGGVQGAGRLTVDLTHGNETEDQWVWEGNQFASNSTRLAFGGQHELAIHNPGPAKVRYAFYYDQSCNCADKRIPLPGGFVLFNFDLPKGRTVDLGFPSVEGWVLRGKVALLENERGHWPEDFRILTSAEQTGKGWLRLPFKTEQADRYYVFIDAPQGVTYAADGSPIPVTLTPLLEVSGGESAAPSAALVVLAIVMAAVARLRRRNG